MRFPFIPDQVDEVNINYVVLFLRKVSQSVFDSNFLEIGVLVFYNCLGSATRPNDVTKGSATSKCPSKPYRQ